MSYTAYGLQANDSMSEEDQTSFICSDELGIIRIKEEYEQKKTTKKKAR